MHFLDMNSAQPGLPIRTERTQRVYSEQDLQTCSDRARGVRKNKQEAKVRAPGRWLDINQGNPFCLRFGCAHDATDHVDSG